MQSASAIDAAYQDGSTFFALYVAGSYPRYEFGAHHIRVIEALERVERGECRRLMISMPPRHGKSKLASEHFPAWYLGRNPTHSIIAASYGQELAEDFGRSVRNQLRDDWWRGCFNPRASLSADSASSTKINLEQGGSYFAVGVGGSATGRGADLLLIDDPIKNREDADSETLRRKMKEWYGSVAYTRLHRGGAIVIIQTRWHEDDLSGWILREHAHEGWEVLSLPAIDDSGRALWPERYPVETLETIKRTIGARDWNALYQQRPAPEEGSFFKGEWFRYWDELPGGMRFYGASDYAVTAKGGDYTVHVVAGVDRDSNLYIVDMWRDQTESLEWVDSFVSLLKAWEPAAWAEEAGVINKSLDPLIRKRLIEERYFKTVREQFSSVADKPTRARSLQGRMQMGKVFWPRPGARAWAADALSEFLVFPQGAHDDVVDACSLLCRMLDSMRAPIEKKREATLEERVAAMTVRKPTFNDLLDQSKRQQKTSVAGW